MLLFSLPTKPVQTTAHVTPSPLLCHYSVTTLSLLFHYSVTTLSLLCHCTALLSGPQKKNCIHPNFPQTKICWRLADLEICTWAHLKKKNIIKFMEKCNNKNCKKSLQHCVFSFLDFVVILITSSIYIFCLFNYFFLLFSQIVFSIF